jgi:anti-anti-sigma factor
VRQASGRTKWACKSQCENPENVTILDVRGRVVFGDAADSFKAELIKLAGNSPCDVIVNFAEATQIDSSGIGPLVQSYVTLTRGGGTLIILSPTGSVREVLEVTHLSTAIPVYTDEAAALASLRSSSARA